MGFKTHTRNLTAGQTFTATAAMNILSISAQMSTADGDNGTYQGSVNLDGTASQPLNIGSGEGRVLATSNPSQPVEGQIFTCVQGTMKLEIGQQ